MEYDGFHRIHCWFLVGLVDTTWYKHHSNAENHAGLWFTRLHSITRSLGLEELCIHMRLVLKSVAFRFLLLTGGFNPLFWQSIGFIGPGIALIGLTTAKRPLIASAWLSLAVGLKSFSHLGFLINLQVVKCVIHSLVYQSWVSLTFIFSCFRKLLQNIPVCYMVHFLILLQHTFGFQSSLNADS